MALAEREFLGLARSTPLAGLTPTENSGVVFSNSSAFRKCLESFLSCLPTRKKGSSWLEVSPRNLCSNQAFC